MKNQIQTTTRTELVPLSSNDVRRICEDLASRLAHATPGSIDPDNFAASLRGWRRFSPKFVENDRALHRIKSKELVALGGKARPFNRAGAEADRAMFDDTADLLKRLMRSLPAEVSHA